MLPYSQNYGVVLAQFCRIDLRLPFWFSFGLFCGSKIYVSVRLVFVQFWLYFLRLHFGSVQPSFGLKSGKSANFGTRHEGRAFAC